LNIEKPDLGISLMPFINDTLTDAHANLDIPFALITTDLLDKKPWAWFSPLACKKASFISTGCVEAREQAISAGAQPEKNFFHRFNF
jgi:hypothetical protein